MTRDEARALVLRLRRQMSQKNPDGELMDEKEFWALVDEAPLTVCVSMLLQPTVDK